MKLPISARLLRCAEYVPAGSRVADVGTDHGYLSVYLLRENIASSVIASDLRPLPLEKARRHAAEYGVSDRMRLVLADGLSGTNPEDVDTVVCAGMGGDLMIRIMEDASWLKDPGYTLILQPQSNVPVVREWLCENGFSIRRESLVEDGNYLYSVLCAVYDGTVRQLSPGQQYIPPWLLTDPLAVVYMERAIKALSVSVQGLRNAEKQREERLQYYSDALAEIKEMRLRYDTGRKCV